MNWKRERPGAYGAGPYRVERHDHAGGFWTASGPSVSAGSYETKAEAQTQCERAMQIRLADPDANAPVVGDIVEIIADGRRGQVSTIMTGGIAAPLHCLRLARGKRLCLFRHEIKVVMP